MCSTLPYCYYTTVKRCGIYKKKQFRQSWPWKAVLEKMYTNSSTYRIYLFLFLFIWSWFFLSYIPLSVNGTRKLFREAISYVFIYMYLRRVCGERTKWEEISTVCCHKKLLFFEKCTTVKTPVFQLISVDFTMHYIYCSIIPWKLCVTKRCVFKLIICYVFHFEIDKAVYNFKEYNVEVVIVCSSILCV